MKFYLFPKNEERRKQWIVRVNRREPSGALWMPKSSARLCSEHFFGGEKSNDPNSVSYLPSVFPTAHVREPRQADFAREERRQRREADAAKQRQQVVSEQRELHERQDDLTDETTFVQDIVNEPPAVNALIQEAIITIEQETQTPMWFNKVMVVEGKSMIKCLTECPVATFVGPMVKNGPRVQFDCHYVSSKDKCTGIITRGDIIRTKSTGQQAKVVTKDVSTNISSTCMPFLELQDKQFSAFTGVTKPIFRFFLHRVGSGLQDSRSISREDKLLLVLVKLKCGSTFVNLASMFDISVSNVKKWFDQGFWALYSASEDLIVWLNKATVQARMPASFRALFPTTRAIIGKACNINTWPHRRRRPPL